MATLTVRNLYDDLKSTLLVQVARQGQSMGEGVRSILRLALTQATLAAGSGQRLARHFQPVAKELSIPPRSLPDGQATAYYARIMALALVTRNERDFELIDGLSVVNPWIAAS